MVKNIIFDVGNVLIKWSNKEIAYRLFPNDPIKGEYADKKIFKNRHWYRFDLGLEEENIIIRDIESEVEEQYKQYVSYCFYNFAKVVDPDEKMNNLGLELANKGYRIYLLSNFPNNFNEVMDKLPIKSCLSGYLYSAQVHINKPDVAIYKALLDKFNLNPDECVFIDDMEANCEGAKKAGINKTFIYKRNFDDLINYLKII